VTGNSPRDGVGDKPDIELTFETEVAAPRSRLFAALTEARHLEHWLCAGATSDPRPGGELVMTWDGPGASAEPFRGQWTAVTPPDACGYHGGHAEYPDGDAGSVTFELEPMASGTRLHTRHTLPGHSDYEPVAARYRAAWPRALARLAAYLTPDPTI
jgi:uncharacterized protein YndB with AHSA1/START domain